MTTRSARAQLSGLAVDLVDFIYPPACLVCRATPQAGPLCADCECALARLPGPVCSGCRLFVTPDLECPLGHSDLVVGALGLFDHHYRTLLHALKFHGDLHTGRWLGRRLGTTLAGWGVAERVKFVVPVPLHRVRQRERGYNQSYEIGVEVARALAVPLVQPLTRRRPTKSQTSLAREERLENVREAFECTTDLEGAPVLLVDDVLTTGATMASCTSALHAAGAGPIFGATVALAEP